MPSRQISNLGACAILQSFNPSYSWLPNISFHFVFRAFSTIIQKFHYILTAPDSACGFESFGWCNALHTWTPIHLSKVYVHKLRFPLSKTAFMKTNEYTVVCASKVNCLPDRQRNTYLWTVRCFELFSVDSVWSSKLTVCNVYFCFVFIAALYWPTASTNLCSTFSRQSKRFEKHSHHVTCYCRVVIGWTHYLWYDSKETVLWSSTAGFN